MPSQPLSVILLLFFLLLVAAALTAWFALTQGMHGHEAEPAKSHERDESDTPSGERAERVVVPAPASRPTNDEIRGARARPMPARAVGDEDPFERFIKSKNDDMQL